MSSTGVSRIEGIDPAVAQKAPCTVATTVNITLSGAQTVDGVAVAETTPATRVLVMAQTAGSENGIYDVKGTAWVRSEDFDGNRDVTTGSLIYVVGGTSNLGGNSYRLSTAEPISIDTTALSFALANISGAGDTGVHVTSYASMRAIDSSTLADGQTIDLSGSTVSGPGTVRTGTVTDNGAVKGTLIVFADDINRYWQRTEAYADAYQNTNLGFEAGEAQTTPTFDGHNTFIGYQSGKATTVARDNTFVGYRSGKNYVTDTLGPGFGGMTAIGSDALLNAGDTYQCTAVGSNACLENTDGKFNHGFGYGALQNVKLTSQNTGCGLLTLGQYEFHIDGTAVGFFAGASANYTEGACLVGLNAGLNIGNLGTDYGSVNGGANGVTLIGNECGSAVLQGDNVTGVGSGALRTVAVNKTGDNTTAIGAQSGQLTLVTVSNCTLLGTMSDVKNDVDDGQVVITSGDGRIRLYDNGAGLTHLTASATRGGAYNIGGFAEAFVFITAATTAVIPVAIPTNAKILGCQLRVDTALVGGETWSAAYTGGSTQSIAGTGQAVAVDTKINKHFDTNVATDITTTTTNITITRDAGSFTAQGLIRGFVYFQSFVDLDNV